MTDTDKSITEADDDLIPVETPPEEGADAPADDHDDEDDGDERLAQSEDDSDEDISSSSNRDRRRKRREIQKKARDAAQRELEFLRQQVTELSQRVHQTETNTATATAQSLSYTLEQQLAKAISEVQQAESIIAAATEAGNGQDVVAAMRIRDQAIAQAQQVQAAKQQAEEMQKQAQQPRVDPTTMSYAKEWMDANPWYKPDGGSRESAIAKAIDAEIAREGYDPRSRLYWEELTSRVADALGGDEAPSAPRRKAPPTGSTREHAPVSTKREIYVTPERKAAMIEAGAWDDPVKRQNMLRAYQAYDNGSAR